MVNQSDVVVFMKGVPSAPRCGFSNAVCQIMRMHDVPFESHDVLSDEEVRQGKYFILKVAFIQKVLIHLSFRQTDKPICRLFHKDKELLALWNNFRATKKFLIAKFR